MAHGLETRVPFLDNDLVDFAMRVPVGLKLGNLGEVVRLNENEPGPRRRSTSRRRATASCCCARRWSGTCRRLSRRREKQGFSAPDASWFKGESIDYVRRALLDRDAAIYEYLDRNGGQGQGKDPPGSHPPPRSVLGPRLGRTVVPHVPAGRAAGGARCRPWLSDGRLFGDGSAGATLVDLALVIAAPVHQSPQALRQRHDGAEADLARPRVRVSRCGS